MQQQLDEIFGIRRVVFRPAGRERFAELGERFRVDGVEYQEVVLEQRVDEGAARLLQADGDALPTKARP